MNIEIRHQNGLGAARKAKFSPWLDHTTLKFTENLKIICENGNVPIFPKKIEKFAAFSKPLSRNKLTAGAPGQGQQHRVAAAGLGWRHRAPERAWQNFGEKQGVLASQRFTPPNSQCRLGLAVVGNNHRCVAAGVVKEKVSASPSATAGFLPHRGSAWGAVGCCRVSWDGLGHHRAA